MRRADFTSERAGSVVVVQAPAGAAYEAFVPRPLPPKLEFRPSLVAVLSEADRALGEVAALGRYVPNPDLFVTAHERLEAVLSTRIEGTQTSLSELLYFEAEVERQEPQEATLQLRDLREVVNYLAAMNHGLRRLGELPLCLRLVRELHAVLMQGVRGGQAVPGELRRGATWIGRQGCRLEDATYVAPPPEELQRVLADWEAFVNQEDTLPPLVRCAIAHYQFEAIHPFADGNGRIGRLLIVLTMCAWGLLPRPLLYLSAHFHRHRDEYYDRLLRVSQQGEWEEWIEFFLRAVAGQSRAAADSANSLLQLREQWRRLMGGTGSGAAAQAVDLLFATPFVNVPRIARELKVSRPTAQKAIEAMLEKGMVVEAGDEIAGILRAVRARPGRPPRWYVAWEVLRALQEAE